MRNRPEGRWHWKEAGLSPGGEGGTEQVAAWLFADLNADVRGHFYV